MHSISKIAAVAALLSIATAGDAPVVQNNPVGTTYTATFPATNAKAVTGAVIAAAAPDGKGTNFQISFYNLPATGNLSYMIHTDKVSPGDCSTAGGVFDPYGGATGSGCASDKASCQVGDLSDKYGDAKILTGGSGTGYFPANYNDLYTSVKAGTEAFFGKGSIVIADSTGAAVACANFVNGLHQMNSGNSTSSASSSMTSQTGSKATGSGGNSGSKGGSQSSSSSSGFAARTAAPVVGAGLLGLAAMLI